ncbi:DNA helicase IV [Mangrovibacter yixingensis]|uniref:DNA helicase IV n=1 Tax=Mangrovibacter yixingensis TaxID=1529639 RepID=UPI001CFADC68|nr:DNA helicase IV [Mangrovibacter yixingensis]
MELKATALGKHLAQHPYNRVTLLNAGVNVAGDKHEYLIPFNQLIAINCKRGLVWGELEFVLPDNKVVRLHGTEWSETQRFWHHLNERWQQWGEEMSQVAAGALNNLVAWYQEVAPEDKWLSLDKVDEVCQRTRQVLQALPLPDQRIPAFDVCRDSWLTCKSWLDDAQAKRLTHNQHYTDVMLERHKDFFAQVESAPLNASQARAVVNGEKNMLVLAGAGSGKTSVLVARAGWLIARNLANADQILLLAFGRKAAQEMDQRIQSRLHTSDITARTFHSLARYIIEQGGRKAPQISELETNTSLRHQLLLDTWVEQCQEKKAQAKGWRQWLEDELEWALPEGDFWQDNDVKKRLAPRLETWLGLIRMHGGTQADMISSAPEDIRDTFQKRVRLMAPLVKAWKKSLKDANALDFSGLIHQAVNVLEKGRFISPWKHILVDEFQDISPQRAALLGALQQQNSQTSLYAVGDDWQAIYRFSGASLDLTTSFNEHFGQGDECALDTTYRFHSRIGEIANAFIQQNPNQREKPLNSVRKGDKKAVNLLDETQLHALLDKMSGYVKPDETILVLARYHFLRPELLQQAATRWPKLQITFMTVHASKGQEADYVIVCGLQEGKDGFPAPARETILEQGLLPAAEEFADAEERRLLYVAMTRAKQKVWLLYNKKQPSRFVEILKELGVPVLKKP